MTNRITEWTRRALPLAWGLAGLVPLAAAQGNPGQAPVAAWRIDGGAQVGDAKVQRAADGTLSGSLFGEPLTGFHAPGERLGVWLRGDPSRPSQAFVGTETPDGTAMVGRGYALDAGSASKNRNVFVFTAVREGGKPPRDKPLPPADSAGPAVVSGALPLLANGAPGDIVLEQAADGSLGGKILGDRLAGHYAPRSGTIVFLRYDGRQPVQLYTGSVTPRGITGEFYALTPRAGGSERRMRYEWSAQAPQLAQAPAIQNRLVPALTQGPLLLSPGVQAGLQGRAAPVTWQALWQEAWAQANSEYVIAVAPAARAHPACAGAIDLRAVVEQVIASVAAGRYGDAVRHTGQFQSGLLCLTRTGARGVEFALSVFVHKAVRRLPPDQARAAVQGAFNPALLTFEQLQFTRSSWWLYAVVANQRAIGNYMRDYPRDLGVLLYDFNRAALVQSPAVDAVLAALSDFSRFGEGNCSLLEMSRSEFRCRHGGAPGLPGARQIGPDAGGGLPSNLQTGGTTVCVIDSARASGPRGMLMCAAQVTAGMTIDPRASPKQLFQPQPAVRDPRCALSDEAQDAPKTEPPKADPKAADKPAVEPPSWLQKVGEAVWGAITALFDKTPDPLPSADLASKQGADAARNALIGLERNKALDNLTSNDPDAYGRYLKAKEGLPATADFEGRQGPDVGPFGGGRGGCGASATVASSRLRALQSCMGGDAGPTPTRSGGVDPTIALLADAGKAPPAAMACHMQAGDLVRAGMDDPKCAVARCVDAQSCPCNRGPTPGAGQAQTPPSDPNTPVINCSGNAQNRSGKTLAGDPCGSLGPLPGTAPPPGTGPGPLPPMPGGPLPTPLPRK